MKKQDLFKFSLTAMCVAVLSACGSSGGGSLAVENTPTTPSANANANTGAANSAELAAAQKAAQEAAAKQAAAEQAAKDAAAKQAAAEQAAKDAAAKAKEDTAKAVEQALKDKEAADKKAAEDQAKAEEEAAKKAAQEAAEKAASDKANPLGSKDILTATPDTTRTVSFVGMKQTVKNQSNLVTNSSSAKDSTSDVPTPMAVQNPHPSLDTIVVAEPNPDAAAARVYLEDFDTRFATGSVPDNAVNKVDSTADYGNRKLSNIYINKVTNGFDKQEAPEIKEKRQAVIDAQKAADNAQKAAQKKVDDLQSELTAMNKRIADVRAEWRAAEAAATAEEKPAVTASYKQQSDILFNKQADLIGKHATAKQELDGAKSAATKAAQAVRLFEDDNGAAPALTNVTPRPEALGQKYVETKTDTVGTDSGAIWTFGQEDIHVGHQNFTEYGKGTKEANVVKNAYVYKGRDLNGKVLVEGGAVKPVVFTAAAPTNQDKINGRTLDTTVAEVYGYRSKARNNNNDGFDAPLDTMDYTVGGSAKAKGTETFDKADLPMNNLPLVNNYYGARLSNVQYGRVTTALNNMAATEDYLKKGVPLDGSVPTYVASFGKYGTEGTENHYFYRGINNVGAEELKLLKADTKNGTILYDGHAVTYGLNNNYRGAVGIPTAIGAKAGFVSGNHAALTVNLANNEVNGNIYNKWYDNTTSTTGLVPVNLVTLKGVIADNGNIAGTATRRDNQATGVFGATLFGNGAEVGGTFASDKHTKDEQWGGVFGGIRVPATPAALKEAGMSVGTDGKN